MLALGAQGHMAWRCLCLGAQRTSFTALTILIGELHTDDRILPPILTRTPRGAGFASGTGHLLGLPIDGEPTNVVGLLVLCLPGDIRTYRAKEGNVEVPRTLHEQGRVHIARIDDMRLWGELFVGECVVDRLRHGDIRDGGFRRLDMGNHMERVVLTRLGHMDFVPRPGDTAFIPKVRVGVIRRVHPPPCRGEVLRCAPPELPLLVSIVLIHPSLSENFDRRHGPEPVGRRGMIEGAEQL
jgi:hypothetical protein